MHSSVGFWLINKLLILFNLKIHIEIDNSSQSYENDLMCMQSKCVWKSDGLIINEGESKNPIWEYFLKYILFFAENPTLLWKYFVLTLKVRWHRHRLNNLQTTVDTFCNTHFHKFTGLFLFGMNTHIKTNFGNFRMMYPIISSSRVTALLNRYFIKQLQGSMNFSFVCSLDS